ncbi:T9SS type A sorting domain-containing protein [Lewinella sp. LCG006]|uniref:T9SS type A sorting domain-containing protein n=1 Tax=Lewinella sp. LCG006 TaxID=3231911 RepID=UPI003460D23C
MLRYLYFFLTTFLPLLLSAQAAHDAQWVLGSPRLLPTDIYHGGTLIDFRSGTPEVSYFDLPIHLDPIGMICDNEGNLVFYTNGCSIINAAHQTMENGDSLNIGGVHDSFCSHSYPSWQGFLALPKPGTEDRYGLFHVYIDRESLRNTEFRYTEIDASANDGLGRVDVLNSLVYQDTVYSQISAVRHANGRDWWIVAAKQNSSQYYITYYGPEGPGATLTQAIGPVWEDMHAASQVIFSPDGSLNVRFDPVSATHLFDFDRCAGTFSNYRMLDFMGDTVSYGGAAISPNNQYLYTSAGRYMYQYDLAAEDVAASRIRIAEYDGYLVLGYPSLPAAFHNMRLAADGKIYGTARGSSNVLHVIHNPNQPGLACNAEQHGLDLATLHAFAPPNYPYFQTWDVEGSPCDTLGVNGPPPVSVNDATEEDTTVRVYPNPARDYIYITSSDQPIKQVQLWDSRGRLLKSFSGPTERIDVRGLPPGFYYLRVFLPDGYTSQKVVVQ